MFYEAHTNICMYMYAYTCISACTYIVKQKQQALCASNKLQADYVSLGNEDVKMGCAYCSTTTAANAVATQTTHTHTHAHL